MNRRKFVAAMAAAGSAAQAAPRLAVDGGAPVRSKPLRPDHWGPMHYDEKERAQVNDVIDTGNPFRWSGRPGTARPAKVATFEKEFAARMSTKYSLAVTSGTAALQTAVAGLGIGPGDEVILPAWTWHSTCTAVIMAGALPVFAEIDETLNLDPNDIEHRITPQTKVIMAVHLQGAQADLDPIMAIARKHKLKVLEDCAQSVGGSYKGRPLGSIGDIGIYSHQVNKTISSGEGGSVVTNDPLLHERGSRFHDVGSFRVAGDTQLERIAGVNFRMSEFTGGVMLEQVRKLDRILATARAAQRRVYDGLRDLPGIRFRKRPAPAGETGDSVYIEFPDKARRDRFLDAMKAENIPARPPAGSVILTVQPYITKKLTAHPNWPTWTIGRGKTVRYGAHTSPRTIDIHSRFAGVSFDPGYSRQDTDDIITAIRRVYPVVTA
ncbi:MAG: DegT/DnrJ/EryC1/StrS family aminotransferase [bacterium]|nr:DegT/DnrJ/EryC1/StrS family aminotransferase [bacterium]